MLKAVLVFILLNSQGNIEEAGIIPFDDMANCTKALLNPTPPQLPPGYHIEANCFQIDDKWLIIKGKEILTSL